MDWSKAKTRDDGSVKIPYNWLHLHYYQALNILFRIENGLRVFVYSVLKNELQSNWVNCNLEADEGKPGTIKSLAKRRISQAKGFGYLGYTVTCPIMYLTSGELIRFITSDAYWNYFKPYFLGKKEIIKNKLDEIGTIRNALAHFRPIKDGDVEVIKQNAKQVLGRIETTLLQQMLQCANIVPTNTDETWYPELSVLGTDLCTLRFFQSQDENWIRLRLNYKCPIVAHSRRYPKNVRLYMLTLVSPAVLEHYPTLSDLIVYSTEQIGLPGSFGRDFKSDVVKELSFVFSRQTLQSNHILVKTALGEVLSTISEETELIRQDNLARGKIVVGVTTSGTPPNGEDCNWWFLDTGPLRNDVREGDPFEYWGSLYSWPRDFITTTEKYPWMPAKVSKLFNPFQ